MQHNNHKKEFLKLIRKYLDGGVTQDQLDFISKYYDTFEKQENILNSISDEDRKLLEEKIELSIIEKIEAGSVKPIYPLWKPISVVAAILLIALSVGLYTNYSIIEYQSPAQKVLLKPDVEPGGNNATLTLSDGSTIFLNDLKNGEITSQTGAKILKAKDGMIIYTAVAKAEGKSILNQFNTISTPNGGQYQIVLPDGSRVWLNAGSSLQYPVNFAGNNRKVILTGEAYFEVNSKVSEKGARVPFLVETQSQIVEVLGTHFNINAYSNEPSTKTTLLEGSVRIASLSSKRETEVILKPNQQSAVIANHEISVSQVNAESMIAWKSGLFQFQDSDIQSVMRELSRWYNVEVMFEGEVPNIKLWGKIYRNVNASEALKILGFFDLKYRIVQEGNTKKIIISG